MHFRHREQCDLVLHDSTVHRMPFACGTGLSRSGNRQSSDCYFDSKTALPTDLSVQQLNTTGTALCQHGTKQRVRVRAHTIKDKSMTLVNVSTKDSVSNLYPQARHGNIRD
jgi:hypothetical protein